MLDLILDSLRVVSLPTKSNFRGINYREVAVFEGPQGWAEFSPFLEYDDQECAPWLACAIEAATVPPPELFRSSISVNATMPALNGESEINRILSTFPGCTAVKIKVGSNHDEDLARIAMVRKLSPMAKIRIDVNGLWSVDQAAKFLDLCGEIEYVEQPCTTVEELRELKSRVADEDPNVLEKYVGDYVFNPKGGGGNIRIDQPVEVMEVGTGFMMTRRSAFERFEKAFPQYSYKPDHVRTEAFDGSREIMQYFQAEIDPASKRYLSEDYWFCQKMIEIGGKIWYCPWMRLQHVGSYIFGGSLIDLASIGAPATADPTQLGKNKKKG